MSFSERELGEAFKVELEGQEYLFQTARNETYLTRFKVYLNKPVRTYAQEFRQFWVKKNLDPKDIPPSQPEIDMILVDDFNKWHAIELKLIKKKQIRKKEKTYKRISPSYYYGLGQTLAYLSFGFDEVAIWQCFDSSTLNDDEIFSYNDALIKIRTPIRHLVGSTFFKIINENGKLRMESELWKDGNRGFKGGIGAYQEKIGKYLIRSVSYNPFLPQQTPEEILLNSNVKAIREFLEIQKSDVWENRDST